VLSVAAPTTTDRTLHDAPGEPVVPLLLFVRSQWFSQENGTPRAGCIGGMHIIKADLLPERELCSANGICRETEAADQSIHVLKTESIMMMSYEMDIAIKDAGFMSVKERNS
jgi:hypothetical protein